MTETAVAEIAQPPIKFSVTDAAIAELAIKYSLPTVPRTPGEYDQLKEDIKVVATVRIAIDKERKTQNAAALEHQRAVNAEGHRIIDALKEIEDPMKVCKQTVDDETERKVREKEEAEALRLKTIEGRIERIEECGVVTVGTSLDDIDARIKLCEALDPADGSFDEFAMRAADAKQVTVANLTAAREAAVNAAITAQELRKGQELLEEAQQKQRDEQKKLDDAREELEKDQREKDEADQKVKDDELELLRKKELEDQHKKDELAEKERAKKVAPDKDKLLMVAQQIRAIQFQQCGDTRAQELMAFYTDRLDTLASEIEMEVAQL